MLALDIPTSILCATLLCLIVLYARHSVSYRSRLPLPPGPPKIPIIGNLFNASTAFPRETYMKWAKECDSDIIHLNVWGCRLLFSRHQERWRLFSRSAPTQTGKSACIISHNGNSVLRPEQPMLIDLMGWGFTFGDEWYWKEAEATNALLRRLLDTPDAFMTHFRQMTGEFVMSVTYGIDVRSSDDPTFTSRAMLCTRSPLRPSPGNTLWWNTFSILQHVPRWFPGAGFKRYAEEGRKLARAMLELPFAESRQQMASGIAPSLFTSESLHALENSDTLFYQERHVQATTMYIGGADTSVSSFGTFIPAMLANPKAQRKAQADIDCVTGGKFLSGFDDNGRLPYITAIVQEILCWKNVTPFAVPRFLVEEDEYRGYRLPADSLVMYPDPYVFNPDRSLLDGELHPAGTLPEVAFGYGRRVCPGRYIATSKLWIVVASVLAAFDIRKATDEQGNIVEPSYEYGSALLRGGLEAAALIRATVP
ncbi:cytochrome P450 [Mycena leptocephala]|nr:cytochrome P450 [Mycena leptocephala]